MKRIIIISFVLMALQARAQVLTIDACQDSALNNYPMIRQFGLIDQTKDLTISNANKAWLPQFEITLIGGVLEGFPSFSAPGSEETSSTNTQLIAIGQLNQMIWDGGITKARKGMIEAQAEIDAAGAVVLGVSKDTVAKHDKFRDKHDLGVILVSDAGNDICERYGTWVEKKMYGRTGMGIERTTFLIDGAGKIARIWRKVKVDGHVQEVLTALQNLP